MLTIDIYEPTIDYTLTPSSLQSSKEGRSREDVTGSHPLLSRAIGEGEEGRRARKELIVIVPYPTGQVGLR
jgi:hypothetical protein